MENPAAMRTSRMVLLFALSLVGANLGAFLEFMAN